METQGVRWDLFGKDERVMEPALEMLQRHMTEEIRDRLAVVGPADGLGQDHGNVDNLQRSHHIVSVTAARKHVKDRTSV